MYKRMYVSMDVCVYIGLYVCVCYSSGLGCGVIGVGARGRVKETKEGGKKMKRGNVNLRAQIYANAPGTDRDLLRVRGVGHEHFEHVVYAVEGQRLEVGEHARDVRVNHRLLAIVGLRLRILLLLHGKVRHRRGSG